MNSLISITNLCVRVGDKVLLGPIDLTLHAGEIVVLMGPSGCGKTTLLRLILCRNSNYELSADTEIRVGSDSNSGLKLGYAPQRSTLFPWLTAAGNIANGLRLLPKQERMFRLNQLSAGLALSDDVLTRWSTQLSGGEAQRVSLARALAPKPDVLLLDEPFTSIDPVQRFRSQDFLTQDIGTSRSALIITHDVEEAVFLADRVIILHGTPGRLHREIRIFKTRTKRGTWRVADKFDRYTHELRAELEALARD